MERNVVRQNLFDWGAFFFGCQTYLAVAYSIVRVWVGRGGRRRERRAACLRLYSKAPCLPLGGDTPDLAREISEDPS